MTVCLNDRHGSGGTNTSKSLSLREIADTTKRVSAPPARLRFRGPRFFLNRRLAEKLIAAGTPRSPYAGVVFL